jgi:predicted aspartyl protease
LYFLQFPWQGINNRFRPSDFLEVKSQKKYFEALTIMKPKRISGWSKRLWAAVAILIALGIVPLPPTICSLNAEVAKTGETATAKSDRVPLFPEMSTEGPVSSYLSRGETVRVKLRIEGSEGTWCAVAKTTEPDNRGYVLCRHLESREAQGGNWQPVGASIIQTGSETSRMTVRHNAVLVPTTLSYKGRKVEAQLLLDTGSSRTVINTETAGRLNIDVAEGRKGRIQVVGGTFVEALPVRLDTIVFGPHSKKNPEILVIEHKGPPGNYDGLLGMDLLRGLKYQLDFDKQMIRWE